MYYVYIIESKQNKSWYIGYSANLRKRIQDHYSGKGCRTTARKSDWFLIYYEAYVNKLDALGRERFLKSGAGRKYARKQLRAYLNV